MNVLLLLVVLLAPAPHVDPQGPGFAAGAAVAARDGGSISTARELYAGARYEEALAVLEGLRASVDAAAERKTVEHYRSLCLLALGRNEEAEEAIGAVVTADPFFRPSETEASPRVRMTYSEVRERLLPGLASARYAEAKQRYDRKAFAEAAAQFRELVLLLDDPQMNGRLQDMRTLAAGFLELATVAATPPPVPPEEEEAPPAAPAGPSEPRVYTSEDAGVVPPEAIRQEVPAIPRAIRDVAVSDGVLDLVIDEQGRVISIALRSRVHPVYDTMLVNAARAWKYKPAKLNGTPVQFRKLLQVTIR